MLLPKTHAITGFSVGLVAYFILGWDITKSIFFFLSSFLVDFDHYIDFLWRTKFRNLNLKYIFKTTPAFDLVQLKIIPNRKDVLNIFIFHTVELLPCILLASIFIKSNFLSVVLMGIFWGTLFHIILDAIHAHKKKIQKSLSLIEYFIKRKLMKKEGVDPDKLLNEILDSIAKQPTKKT